MGAPITAPWRNTEPGTCLQSSTCSAYAAASGSLSYSTVTRYISSFRSLAWETNHVVSGNVLATALAVSAGLAGSVQVALMSRLGERIGVFQALAFSTLLTALLAFAMLLVVRRTAAGYERALHQPWWMLLGGVMGLLIVFTVTYAGPRIGVAATVGILIAGQLIMGAAIDKWGLFGSERIPLHWPRLIGLALLAAGAALSLRK